MERFTNDVILRVKSVLNVFLVLREEREGRRKEERKEEIRERRYFSLTIIINNKSRYFCSL